MHNHYDLIPALIFLIINITGIAWNLVDYVNNGTKINIVFVSAHTMLFWFTLANL